MTFTPYKANPDRIREIRLEHNLSMRAAVAHDRRDHILKEIAKVKTIKDARAALTELAWLVL